MGVLEEESPRRFSGMEFVAVVLLMAVTIANRKLDLGLESSDMIFLTTAVFTLIGGRTVVKRAAIQANAAKATADATVRVAAVTPPPAATSVTVTQEAKP